MLLEARVKVTRLVQIYLVELAEILLGDHSRATSLGHLLEALVVQQEPLGRVLEVLGLDKQILLPAVVACSCLDSLLRRCSHNSKGVACLDSQRLEVSAEMVEALVLLALQVALELLQVLRVVLQVLQVLQEALGDRLQAVLVALALSQDKPAVLSVHLLRPGAISLRSQILQGLLQGEGLSEPNDGLDNRKDVQTTEFRTKQFDPSSQSRKKDAARLRAIQSP